MERELRAKVDTVSAAIGAEQVWSWWATHAAEKCPEKMQIIERKLAGVCRAAEGLLLRTWPRVIAVAEALLQRRRLSGRQIEAILKSEGIPRRTHPKRAAAELRRQRRNPPCIARRLSIGHRREPGRTRRDRHGRRPFRRKCPPEF